MKSQHVRSGSPDSLSTGLLAFAADRESHGKPERARLAREAARELTEDGGAVEFEGVLYVIGPDATYTRYSGTREEVLADLDEFGEACVHDGKVTLAKDVARAHADITAGDRSVRIGHIEYVVKDH